MALTLDSPRGFAAALGAAHDVALSAYRLPAATEAELVAAAARGARVAVDLAAAAAGPYDAGLAAANAAAADRLRAGGASVSLQTRVHLKAAVLDGVAWLDDRNWARAGPALIVRDDDPGDVAAVRASIAGNARADRAGSLALDKAGALRAEHDLIAAGGTGRIDCASETFGNGVVSHALREHAAAGDAVRLLVDARDARGSGERAALGALVRAGAEVRTVAGGVDKLAAAGDAAWVGSANATSIPPGGDFSDWGLATRRPEIVRAVQAAFEREWRRGAPLEATGP